MYGVWQYNSSCSSTGLKEHFQTERATMEEKTLEVKEGSRDSV